MRSHILRTLTGGQKIRYMYLGIHIHHIKFNRVNVSVHFGMILS